MQNYFQSLGTADMWLKILLVAMTAPIWIPVAKVFWREIQEALADDGGFLGTWKAGQGTTREPGLDPWVNVPRHGGASSGRRRSAAERRRTR